MEYPSIILQVVLITVCEIKKKKKGENSKKFSRKSFFNLGEKKNTTEFIFNLAVYYI